MIIKRHHIIHILLLTTPLHSYTFDKPKVLVGSGVFVCSLMYSFHAIVKRNMPLTSRSTKRVLQKRIAASAVAGVCGISLALYGAHKKNKGSDEKKNNIRNKLAGTQPS